MLRELKISNYALIDLVELNFQRGLTAITGETGSGKSILLGAFGLLLGERADGKTIKNPELKCIVEAVFDIKGYGLQHFFSENDLDFEQLTTIRREIGPGGKSRAFINDTPVQLHTVRALGAMLVDIHSQHENSLLGQRDFQFSTIDAFAGNENALSEYRTVFNSYRSLKIELEELIKNEAAISQELDYLRFQLNELNAAGLDELDQRAMEQELETVTHAEQIRSGLTSALEILDAEQDGALAQITSVKNYLQRMTQYNEQLEGFAARTDSCLIELRELTREIEAFQDNVQHDPQRAEILNEQLSALYRLQQKHRMQTVEELISLKREIELKCGGFENTGERKDDLQRRLDKELISLTDHASDVTSSRTKAAVKAQKEVKQYFLSLGLEFAELKIELSQATEFNAYGKDDIQFLFKANKGGALLPVHKAASGGEISRVMLALKAAISKHKKLPVLILDEIDQGVSGETGKKIGDVLREMSGQMQLLTITHLPQIAGKANHHLKVYKRVKGEVTSTFVEELDEDGRINEIAEMLSGKDITRAALENARELRS